MLELIPSLIPLLIVDVLNPVLFVLLVVAVGTRRPVANSSAFLAGHTVAYFVTGIVIALGLERFTARFSNPQPIDFFVELSIGLLCLWAALAARGGKASEERRPESELTPVSCFTYGAVVNFIGVPFAIPYLAVINQILKADLSVDASIVMLIAYNLSYALPFAMVLIFIAIAGDASRPVLERINNALVIIADKLMPLLMLLLGIALIADAISYLVTGASLW